MALIAMNVANPPELPGRMFAELAGYVAPKRKAVDPDDAETGPVVIHVNTGIPAPDEPF
jgi:hypothetical protein